MGCVTCCLVVTLMFLLLNVILVNTQIVSIPTTNLAPALGATEFSLQCNINNFEAATNLALAWTKDDELVSWNSDIQGNFNGQIRETALGMTIFYYLDIQQVREIHGGIYKCLVADGQPTSYTEVASAEVTLQIPYFPPQQYPMCSPRESTIAVIGTDLTMTCTSLPGSPEVLLLLQRNSATLSTGATMNNMIQVEYTHRVSSSDNGASFQCTIIGTGQFSDQRRTCTVGPIQAVAGLPRISPTILNKSVGQDATFTCELTFSGTIEWYTEPITFASGYTENGMTFTLTNVQLTDNEKQVVCKATIGGAVVEDRAQLNVNPAEPTTMPIATTAATTNKPTTMKRTTAIGLNPPTGPITSNPINPPVIMSTTGNGGMMPVTDPAPGGTTSGSPQNTDSSVTISSGTSKSTQSLSPTQGEDDMVLIIAIASVGGLVFILIVVVVGACICCYGRRPKPIVMTDGNESDFDSDASWEADGAMTRRSRIQVRGSPSDPPPRLPETNKGFEDDHSRARHLLKIPEDGLSTITSGTTMSPSLAYAMDYLSSPDDPMGDDMSSTAFTNDSQFYQMDPGALERGFTDDHAIYSQGPTHFGHAGPPSFDPAPPGTQTGGYPDDFSESDTFVRHYDVVPKEQEPDMPTYALPHRDRISKPGNQKVVYNPQNMPDLHHDIPSKRPSVPYVNTAFHGNDQGFVNYRIYQSPDDPDNNLQYF